MELKEVPLHCPSTALAAGSTWEGLGSGPVTGLAVGNRDRSHSKPDVPNLLWEMPLLLGGGTGTVSSRKPLQPPAAATAFVPAKFSVAYCWCQQESAVPGSGSEWWWL